MLDALVPAGDALTTAVSQGLSAAACLDQAIGAAAAGAESTKTMRASAGRSAYVPESAQMGVPDPGAMGVVEWMLGVREALV
jgi:dihydroxyacetone kinase